MLDAKLAGESIKRPEPVPETPVVDLMEALRRSVADVQGRRPSSGNGTKTTSGAKRKTASTRKSA